MVGIKLLFRQPRRHLPLIRTRFATNLDFCASLLAVCTNRNCSSAHACCLFTCDAQWPHSLSDES